MISRIQVIAYSLLLILLSCSRTEKDPRLETINETITANPLRGKLMLDSIDKDGLSERNRHYYDLLQIKSMDKAYKNHQSDSLILDVIDYYSTYKKLPEYAEALYYGGRVYSDLGDYPTALRYFQDALDNVNVYSRDQKGKRIEFRSTVISHIAHILLKLRLYNDAKKYLYELIEIDAIPDNKTDQIADLNWLVWLHDKTGQNDSAIYFAKKALSISDIRDKPQFVDVSASLAGLYLKNNEIDSARLIIRDVMGATDNLNRNYILSIASKVYEKANIKDSAYYCAKKIIYSNSDDNKRDGYSMLLSEYLINESPYDSVIKYIIDFNNLLDRQYGEIESQEALIQTARYNYTQHDKKREKAEQRNRLLINIIGLGLIVILSLVSLVFFIKFRTRNQILRLQDSLEKLKNLDYSINDKSEESPVRSSVFPKYEVMNLSDIRKRKSILQEEIKYRLNNFASKEDSDNIAFQLSPELTREIFAIIETETTISSTNPIWHEIMREIQDNSPVFFNNLTILSNGCLDNFSVKLAMLIKCGFELRVIAKMMNISKSGLIYKRKKLYKKIIPEEWGQIDEADFVRKI